MGYLAKPKSDFERVLDVYNNLTPEQKLFVAPRGRFVDSPNLVYRHLAPEDAGFVEMYRMSPSERKAFLTLAVRPEAQGKGIGKKLLKKAIKDAKLMRDIESIAYKVDNDNIASLKLGASVGKLKNKTPDFTEYEIDAIRNDWKAYKRTKKIFDKLTREQQLLVDPAGTWEYSPVVYHRVFDKKNRGFAELYSQDDGTHEVAIAVDPKHQGKGLGKSLMQRLIEKANRNNIDEIVYAPLETNTASVNLGAHFGGDPVGKTKDGNLKFVIDTNRATRDKVSPEKRALIKRIINAYKEKYNTDLSYMQFEDSPVAYFNNGKKVGDDFNLPFGGSWTKKKKIYLNENMEAPMKAFGIEEDKDTFTSRIIAHELGHEMYRNHATAEMKEQIAREILAKKFTTAYLDTVDAKKKAEEGFAEYVANSIVSD